MTKWGLEGGGSATQETPLGTLDRRLTSHGAGVSGPCGDPEIHTGRQLSPRRGYFGAVSAAALGGHSPGVRLHPPCQEGRGTQELRLLRPLPAVDIRRARASATAPGCHGDPELARRGFLLATSSHPIQPGLLTRLREIQPARPPGECHGAEEGAGVRGLCYGARREGKLSCGQTWGGPWGTGGQWEKDAGPGTDSPLFPKAPGNGDEPGSWSQPGDPALHPRPGLLTTVDFLNPRYCSYLGPWWPHDSRIPLKWTKHSVGPRALAKPPGSAHPSSGHQMVPTPQLRAEGPGPRAHPRAERTWPALCWKPGHHFPQKQEHAGDFTLHGSRKLRSTSF